MAQKVSDADKRITDQKSLIGELQDNICNEQQARERHTEEQKKDILKKENMIEQQKKKVCDFAEKKIKFAFIVNWYVFPIITVAFTLFVVLFIMLQFLFKNESWNFSVNLISMLKGTVFWEELGENALSVIDGALVTLSVTAVGFARKRIFKRSEMQIDKADRIQRYISNNELQ